MPGENRTSRQIAAHLVQSYMENGADSSAVEEMTAGLGRKLPEIKKLGNAECCRQMGSLVYCLSDMCASCREAAIASARGETDQTGIKVDQASKRIHEIGVILTEIRDGHPQEYENYCRGFVDDWKNIRFDGGERVLRNIEKCRKHADVSAEPEEKHNVVSL